jgi:hypothetical protein
MSLLTEETPKKKYFKEVFGRERLPMSARYELWLDKAGKCPFCKSWHEPGSRHKGYDDEDTADIDALLYRLHADKMSGL